MYLQIDEKEICLLTDQDKEMLGEYADGVNHDDLMQKVYTITVLAFMSGMKYVKENE
jgi:hypothetical protein